MDKFVESSWFVRIVALLLTILLYISVNFGDFQLTQKADDSAQTNSEVITDVPVQAYYDTENLFVSGIPDKVKVELKGPKSIIESTKRLRDFELFIDLTNTSIGKHRVPIKYKQLSDKLKVTVIPETVDVTIEEKVSDYFVVSPEFNDNMLAEGYQEEAVSVDPKRVKVTGSKAALNKIVYVKATLDVKEKVDKETTGTAKVQVLDGDLNKLDVKIEPETVQVSISVKNPSKKIALRFFPKGTPPKGIKIKSIKPETEEITIYGKESILRDMEELVVPVEVDSIKKDTTLTVPIEIGEGLNFVSPQLVKVKVTVEGSPEGEPEKKNGE
ncbi:CdaR family protein [Bacillus sp. FJAT-27231]|uniref:CdaR family protein n=1 Tax=Bacillus sp. FJAT-27231 TaxID=1679168 RepID=UPI0006717134|nr:CdaR family protein [Bacillus sp. FJAT-27231]